MRSSTRTRTGRRQFLRSSLAAGTAGAALYVAAPASAQSGSITGQFSVRDFGATGNGSTDDAPAVQAALDAVAAAGGGTVVFPAGLYVIASPVLRDFVNQAAVITIHGYGSSSQVVIKAGAEAMALDLRNLESVAIDNLVFVGTPGVITDAKVALALRSCVQATIRRCDFYGVSAKATGGAVVQAIDTNLHIAQSAFLGCGGNSGVATPVVGNVDWRALMVTDTHFWITVI